MLVLSFSSFGRGERVKEGDGFSWGHGRARDTFLREGWGAAFLLLSRKRGEGRAQFA